MGSGKTAVGRRLARELGLPFHDADQEIEQRTGVDIPFIFDKEGEEGFRRREKEIIAELTGVPGIVLATGGGAVLDPDNRNRLTTHGTVVYLQTSVQQQLLRTRHGNRRPLLNTERPADVLEALMREREPLYEVLADIVVNTDGRKVVAVTSEILAKLKDE